ncbi:MAG: family 10 glycosylhydrolase [Oscillospiraceae bacterium]|nr:family 10 glycosylhydrolase [Oscillospiraceae bacterium]
MKKLFLLLIIPLVPLMYTACTKGDDGDSSVTGGLIHAEQTPILETKSTPTADSLYSTLNHDEIIGVWISYIEISGILTKKSEKQFRESYTEMMDNCLELGINTVYVHSRSFGDALYDSDYYPWSKYVTGTIGKVPDFDPLEVMIEETHKRDISFHAWINPMRIQHDSDISTVSADYPIGEWYGDDSKRGKYIVKHGDNWYLNPAYDEVTELIGNGAREIAAKYNVDGVHIDDYFYPTTAASFDAQAFRESTFTELSRFRLFNCSNMVRTLYTAVKQGNPNALFGISPQGSVENNTEQLYADVEAWCKNIGYADYIAPQFYYGFENSEQPYIECINRWQEMLNGSPIKLVFGLSVYKIGSEDIWAGDGAEEWITENQILLRQIQAAREINNYGGIIFFSYNWLFSPVHVTDAIRDEIDAFKPIL